MNVRNKKLQNLFLTLMLIVAMALTVTGCGNKKETPQATGGSGTESESSQAAGDSGSESKDKSSESESADISGSEQSPGDVKVLGEGKTVIYFTVVDKDKNETKFEIRTDKKTVGDALLEHDLIAGDKGEFGLYVKKVNGITADYDVDKSYWAFYVNGEYATAGVDSTDVKEGETYTFKVEK